MNDNHKGWSDVVLDGRAELIVGWRPRRSRLDAVAIELSKEVAEELRTLCLATVDQLANLIGRP